ncbi:MAG: energy-coupling factor ABC transporter permease [Cyanobium sp.]
MNLRSNLTPTLAVGASALVVPLLMAAPAMAMHIEPGVLPAQKVVYANYVAVATLAGFTPALLRNPWLIVKTIVASVFFSCLMEIFHLPVGASELHLVGASTVYFLFGFLPTLFGFGLGLLMQGLLFEHQDLVHLGVNSLSLMLPLIATHQLIGKRFFAGKSPQLVARWREIVRFDASYYTGVVGMVGFWLLNGNEATPLANWAVFAISYLPLVLLEPVLTLVFVKAVNSSSPASFLRRLTVADELNLSRS